MKEPEATRECPKCGKVAWLYEHTAEAFTKTTYICNACSTATTMLTYTGVEK